MFCLGVGVLSRPTQRPAYLVVILQDEAGEAGQRPSEGQLNLSRMMKNVGQLQVSILLVIIFLMVIKPGGIVSG